MYYGCLKWIFNISGVLEIINDAEVGNNKKQPL